MEINPKGLYKFHKSKDSWKLKEDKLVILLQNIKFESIIFSPTFNFMDNNFESWQVKSAGYNLDFLKFFSDDQASVTCVNSITDFIFLKFDSIAGLSSVEASLITKVDTSNSQSKSFKSFSTTSNNISNPRCGVEA